MLGGPDGTRTSKDRMTLAPNESSELTSCPVSGVALRQSPLRRIEQLPGPKGLPLLGNLLQLDIERLHLVFEEWARTHGSVCAFRAGPKRVLIVSEPSAIEEVLRARPHDYRRMSRVATVLPEMGMPGVFSAEGADWRAQRALVAPALSPRRLSDFYPVARAIVEKLERRWRIAADRGAELDPVSEFKRLTVDVTTRLVFGHDANTIEHDEDHLQRQLRSIFPSINRRLAAAVPYWRLLRLPVDRRLDGDIAQLHERLRLLLDGARQRLAREPERANAPSDLLEAMLLAKDESGRPFSDALILGNALQMLLAGEDTTALGLAWAVHLLCEHPDVVARLRRELEQELGAERMPRDVGAASRLPWLNAILHETLRLRSVAPAIYLESAADVVLAGVAVPRGTWLVLLTRLAGKSQAHVVDRPLEFLPERWLESKSRDTLRASVPFGSGPRVCPGRALALLEMQLALVMLYENFEVTRVGSAESVRERFEFIMEPVGLRVRLRHREPAR